MACITVRIRATVSLLEAAKRIGEILGVPLEKYPSDGFDEYPAYAYRELSDRGITLRLLGAPPNAEDLIQNWPSGWGDEDRHLCFTLCAHSEFPVKEMELKLPYEDAFAFARDFIRKLRQAGLQVYDEKPPYVTDRDIDTVVKV